ncbi:unnamed protein product [Ambrosiozyma monospora]|uniref:Unnamed protein product n=1 Tax=Ambrosiozyma monospora TaxID=43982 RepID=A0A9W6Z2N0_AMBMO|nr:unnamed protein product [Ambrosiozyma monospora]
MNLSNLLSVVNSLPLELKLEVIANTLKLMAEEESWVLGKTIFLRSPKWKLFQTALSWFEPECEVLIESAHVMRVTFQLISPVRMNFGIKLAKSTLPSYARFLSQFSLQKLTFDPRGLFGNEGFFAVNVILSKLSPREFVFVDFFSNMPMRWACHITKISCFCPESMDFIVANISKLSKLKEVHLHFDSFDQSTLDRLNSLCCDVDQVDKIVLIPEVGFKVVGDDDISNLKSTMKEFGFKLELELCEFSVKLGSAEFELLEMCNKDKTIKKLELSGEVNDDHNLEFISSLKIQQLHLMEVVMKDTPITNHNCQALIISDLARINNCDFSGLVALKKVHIQHYCGPYRESHIDTDSLNTLSCNIESFELDCNLDADDGLSEYVKFHEQFRLPANLVSLTCNDWMVRAQVIHTSHLKCLKEVLFKNSETLCRNDPIWSLLPTTVKTVISGIAGYDDSKFSLSRGKLVAILRTIIAVYT